ncbi:unnamed protein product [Macrosiphum euphorbiae]|uniref:Uncharacterized protein n=1 Tax=Macrosiphum euphorbiae TaxID=13131 RepID=A0AAV0WL30_9HEMI|nr:unnamed protein product [Macrosiphum euphorbiae]
MYCTCNMYTVEQENVLKCGVDEKTETIELVGTGLLTIEEQFKGHASQNILQPVTSIQNSKLIDIIPETKIITEEQNLEQDATFIRP